MDIIISIKNNTCGGRCAGLDPGLLGRGPLGDGEGR
jgi:hypothetical protein